MGLGKVVGWGIAFVFLIGVTLSTLANVLDTMAQYSAIPLGWLIASLGAVALWAVITYFVGRRFVRAVRQYRASRK